MSEQKVNWQILVASFLVGFLLILTNLAINTLWNKNSSHKLGVGSAGMATTTGSVLNLIGTRSGTTTTGVAFPAGSPISATTSTAFFVPDGIKSVGIYVLPVLASTSLQSPLVNISLAGSLDNQCNTASSTGGALNPVLTTDINWFDIGTHLANQLVSLTPAAGTSTIAYVPTTASGKVFTLTNVTEKCIRVDVAASGTVLLVQGVIEL